MSVQELFDSRRYDVVGSWIGDGEIQCTDGSSWHSECEAIFLGEGTPRVFCALPQDINRLRMWTTNIASVSVSCGETRLRSSGNIVHSTLYGEHSQRYDLALLLRRMIASPALGNDSTPSSLCFSLTNLLSFPAPGCDIRPIEVKLALKGLGERKIVVEPVSGFGNRKDRCRLLRSPQITARLRVPIESDEEISAAESDVTDICTLLSLAEGCVVNWVKYDVLGESDGVVRQVFCSRKSGSYAPLKLVNMDMADYLAKTYPVYMRRSAEWSVGREVVVAYLEGKDETDYLETRAAKLALALEMIVDKICEARGFSTTVLRDFGPLNQDLRKAIENHVCDSAKRAKLYERLRGLNRVSFRAKIEFVSGQVKTPFEREELDRFVKSRNSLVHEGKFYVQLPESEQVENAKPFDTIWEEYCSMTHTMDKLLLRIAGYSGKYLDPRKVWETYRELP